MECLGSETVALYVAGGLSPGLRGRADAHVDRCPACRTWIARAARMATREGASSTAPSSDVTAWPVRGTNIGRYVVEGVVGRGAMGVVLRARDPLLDRSVALKLLHRAADSERTHAALLGEARSLARLSDPHVVQIFDIETWCGRLVLAMELIEGASLRRAAAQASRSERLRMLLLAARGLAAAHAAGIVHRDFKPDNVLVADDGRILVGDFGLACLVSSDRMDDRTLDGTQEGEMIVGTPAYMAPEQRIGASVDARADQFAFCVTATEVLLGWRAQAVDGIRDANRLAHALRSLPRPLVRALVRGLAAIPERRAPTMDAILFALERTAPRRGTGLAWTAVLAVPLVLSLALADATPARPPEVEAHGGDPVARGLVHAHLGASAASYATGDLRGARAAARSAVQTAEASDDPQALVSALVGRAKLAILDDDENGSQADLERAYMLARRERLDEDAASIALQLARSINRDKHRTDEAAEWLRRAETIAQGPQRALVASTRARFEVLHGRLDAAEAQSDAAIATLTGDADVGSADELFARLRAASRPSRAEDRDAILHVIEDVAAVWCSLDRCRDSARASRYVIEDLIAELGPDHLEVAQARVSLAGYLRLFGDNAGARVELEAAIAVLEREPRPDPYALAVATINLALALQQLGETRRALDFALLGVTRIEQVFGPTSGNLVEPLLVSASLERSLGGGTAARSHLERALVAAEQAYGEEPNDVTGRILLGLAYNAQDAADVERAHTMAERAVRNCDAVGVASVPCGAALGVLAWSMLRSDPARARALLLRQLTMVAELRTRDDGLGELVERQEAVAWRALAEAQHRLGAHEEAALLRERAIAALVAIDGREAENVRVAKLPLGQLP